MNQEKIMELVLDHYENPRNYGTKEDADVAYEGGNPGCGDIIRVYLSVDSEGVVNDIGFSGEGCMLSQAGASIVLEKMKGRTIDELEGIPVDIVRETLGKKLVATRPNCARLGFNTMKNAVKKWRKLKMLSSIEDSKES
jgi:nitrogen fixation NifU-like protein